uniref:Microtubule-associated protein n=1 Tax=Parastrongyloides trichosuri TaxID=131310 RepID=A0A0N4Z2H7_PARTI
MEQQAVSEEKKNTSSDIFQGFLNNPLINEVSNNVMSALSDHIKNVQHHGENDKQQDSGVDDIEETFQKVDASKKDDEPKDDHKEDKNEHNPINDFFNNQFGSKIGGFVGNITSNVIDSIKHENHDVSLDDVHNENRTETPEPTKEEFVISNNNDEKHPQEPSGGINLGTLISGAQDIFAQHGDKIHDVVKNIIPSIGGDNHLNDAPQEPQSVVNDNEDDKSKGNSNNMSIPKVDIIAASPLPFDHHHDHAPIEPTHDTKEPVNDNIVDEIQEEFSCVKLQGYTQENSDVHDLVDFGDNNNIKKEEQFVESQHQEEIKEPIVVDIHKEILIKKEVTPEKEDAEVNHEISVHSHEIINHEEPFIEIKQEVEEKVEIPQPVTVPIHAEIKNEIEHDVKDEIKNDVQNEIKNEIKNDVKNEVKKVDNKKTTPAPSKPKVPSTTTKSSPAPAKPVSKTSTTRTPTKAPAPKTPVTKTATPRVPPATRPAPRPTTTTTTSTSNDKLPSYARPTGASQRASTVGTKSPNSVQSPSKTSSLASSSGIRPLPKIANKYKDVKSKVFSSISQPTPTEKSNPVKTPSKPATNGIKPLPKTKLNWKAESKVGSFANIQHKPAGGHVKTSNNKPAPPTTKVGNVTAELPGNINPLNTSEALGQ